MRFFLLPDISTVLKYLTPSATNFKVAYTTARRKAFNFLNAGPSSKVGQATQAYTDEYLEDLKDLYQQVGAKIQRLTK